MDYSLLKELCEISAVSGSEYNFTKPVYDIFSRFFDEVASDDFGSIYGYIRSGSGNAPLIMIDAHIDTIGLMVSKINDGGYLSFIPVGGVDPRTLLSCEVIIHGKKEVYGIIGAVPPHLLSKKDADSAVSSDTLSIDTGCSKEHISKLVSVGDFIEIKRVFRPLLGDKVSCGGLDNRLGLFTSLNAVKNLKLKNLDICVVASSGEETGRNGAFLAAGKLEPSLAVIVDTTHGDTPDSPSAVGTKLGMGGAICLGPCLSREYNIKLENTAQKYNIPYSLEVEEGDPGTDAWKIQFSNLGVPCVMVSLPLRYMHTNVETASLKDSEYASRLINKFISELDGGDGNA